jgi:hypothetical protein
VVSAVVLLGQEYEGLIRRYAVGRGDSVGFGVLCACWGVLEEDRFVERWVVIGCYVDRDDGDRFGLRAVSMGRREVELMVGPTRGLRVEPTVIVER